MDATITTDACSDLLRKPKVGSALHDGRSDTTTKTLPAAAALRELLAAGPVDSRAVQAGMEARSFTPKQVRKGREVLGVVIERTGFGAETGTTWALPSTGVSGGQECRAAGNDGEAARQPVRSCGALRACTPRVRAREDGVRPEGSALDAPRGCAHALEDDVSAGSEGIGSTDTALGQELAKVNTAVVPAVAPPVVRWRAEAPAAAVAATPAPIESPWTTARVKFYVEVRGVDAVTARRVALRLLDRDRQNSAEASCLECQGYGMRSLCGMAGPRAIEELWAADCLRRDAPG